jgi:hypothetical protein
MTFRLSETLQNWKVSGSAGNAAFHQTEGARVLVAPQLGRLQWAEGAYPTPRGPIRVRHERQADGRVKSDIAVPPGIEIVR